LETIILTDFGKIAEWLTEHLGGTLTGAGAMIAAAWHFWTVTRKKNKLEGAKLDLEGAEVDHKKAVLKKETLELMYEQLDIPHERLARAESEKQTYSEKIFRLERDIRVHLEENPNCSIPKKN
jgi:hypothetical protein